jgi:hypothetical protein
MSFMRSTLSSYVLHVSRLIKVSKRDRIMQNISFLSCPYVYHAMRTLRRDKGNVPHMLYRGSKKGKAVPVTDPEGPYGCETLMFPHFLDNRLADGGKVVSPTRRPPFTPKKISGTYLC